MSSVTEDQIVERVKTLLEAVHVPAYELDEAKKRASNHTLPDVYAELHLTLEGFGGASLDGHSDLDEYVLAVRACAMSIANVHLVRRRVRDAIYARPLAAGSQTSTTPQLGRPGEMTGQDAEGYFTALDEYTFTFD